MKKIHFTDRYLLNPRHLVTVFVIGGGGAIWGNVYGSSDNFKSGFKYHVLAATSWGKASFTLSYYVRGTWK